MPNKRHPLSNESKTNQEDDSTSAGTAGQSGARYKDPFAGETRDDLLSPQEIRRLKSVHKDLHKTRVQKQKSLMEERAVLKTVSKVANRQKGLANSMGGSAKYKTHPISAKFRGDKQVNPAPSHNESVTNVEEKEAQENRNENKHRNTPKFNPRPRFPGG